MHLSEWNHLRWEQQSRVEPPHRIQVLCFERGIKRKNPKDTQYAVGFLHCQLFTAGTAMLESPRRDDHSINFCPLQTKRTQAFNPSQSPICALAAFRGQAPGNQSQVKPIE